MFKFRILLTILYLVLCLINCSDSQSLSPSIKINEVRPFQVNVLKICYELILTNTSPSYLVMMGVTVGGQNYVIEDNTVSGDINQEISTSGNYSFLWTQALTGTYVFSLFATGGTGGSGIISVTRNISVRFGGSRHPWVEVDCYSLAPYFLNPKVSDCYSKKDCLVDYGRAVTIIPPSTENTCGTNPTSVTISDNCPAQNLKNMEIGLNQNIFSQS